MPFIGDTELKPFSLADIMQNAQLMRARDQQMEMQRQQLALQQQGAQQQQATFARQQQDWSREDAARASLADLVNTRGPNGAYDTKGQAFQNYSSANPVGAMDMLSKFDAQQHEQVQKRAQLVGEAAQWADTPEKWDAAVDYLSKLYPDLAAYKGQFSPETRMAAISSAGQLKEYYDRNKPMVVSENSALVSPDGKELYRAPPKPEYKTLGQGETLVQTGGGNTPLTVEGLRPLFVAQESSGDYTAKNASTGALGRYQIMPATGQSLAQRLGIPWKPELMTANSSEARAYQDQLGNAAIQESIAAGSGSPQRIFSHYYSGSPTAYLNPQGNPKTARYVQDMMGRLGSGAKVVAQGQPKPEKQQDAPTGYRWTANGNLEPIPGGPQDPGTVDLPAPREMAKRNASYPKVTQSYNQSIRDIDAQIKDLTTLRESKGLNSIVGPIDGRMGSILPESTKAQALLNKIQARGQFRALADMRANSPTGGALGNVSDAEGRTLRQSVAALDQTQGEDSFRAAIDQYINDLNFSKNNLTQGYEDTYAYRSAGRSGGAAPSSGWGKATVVTR